MEKNEKNVFDWSFSHFFLNDNLFKEWIEGDKETLSDTQYKAEASRAGHARHVLRQASATAPPFRTARPISYKYKSGLRAQRHCPFKNVTG